MENDRFLQVMEWRSYLLQKGHNCDDLHLMAQLCSSLENLALLKYFYNVFVTVGQKMRTQFNKKHFLSF